ncbi:MAG: SpoIID/LytB domain-containing protein [Bacillota bacterium]|jgi:stage II sporulation protein D
MADKKTLKKAIVLGVVVSLTAIAGIFAPAHRVGAQEPGIASGVEPEILVGLTRCSSLSLGVSGDYKVSMPDSHDFQASGQDKVVLEAREGKIVLSASSTAGTAWNAQTLGPVLIAPSSETDAFFSILAHTNSDANLTGRSYRGSAVVIQEGGSLFVANLLDIEKYLWSVVSCEIPSGWPVEALKAQAVASRTYALYKACPPNGSTPVSNRALLQTRSLASGDIKIWATDQIYRGKAYEDPRAIESCILTKGQILTYQKLPVGAYFHADAAGMTEDSRFVWGGAIPYLTGVEEVPHSSPYSQWEISFDADTVTHKMAQAGLAGPVDMITGLEPGVSGRWFGVNLSSANGDLRVKGNEFRLIMDLRSLWFSVFRHGGNQETRGCLNPGLPVSVDNGSSIQSVDLGGCTIVGDGAGAIASNGAFVVSPGHDGPLTFLFHGRGWGHGVGMSQWGARAMAGQGADFSQILMYYYPATNIELWW